MSLNRRPETRAESTPRGKGTVLQAITQNVPNWLQVDVIRERGVKVTPVRAWLGQTICRVVSRCITSDPWPGLLDRGRRPEKCKNQRSGNVWREALKQ